MYIQNSLLSELIKWVHMNDWIKYFGRKFVPRKKVHSLTAFKEETN